MESSRTSLASRTHFEVALASKVKSLASRPQVFENWLVLGSRTAVFFELLKFCGALEKFLWRLFFFGEHLPLVLGLESVCPRKGCPWPRIFFVSLASRTHFKVLSLGLEASSPRKLACPRLEDSSIFWIVKILWSAWKMFWKTFFFGDCLKNFCEDLFFFFGEHLRLCPRSLASSVSVLGIEGVCPRKGCSWPRIFLCPWPRALCPRLHFCQIHCWLCESWFQMYFCFNRTDVKL